MCLRFPGIVFIALVLILGSSLAYWWVVGGVQTAVCSICVVSVLAWLFCCACGIFSMLCQRTRVLIVLQCIYHNPTWGEFCKTVFLPNLQWCHSASLVCQSSAAHVVCLCTLLQSRLPQGWRELVWWCVEIILVSFLLGHIHQQLGALWVWGMPIIPPVVVHRYLFVLLQVLVHCWSFHGDCIVPWCPEGWPMLGCTCICIGLWKWILMQGKNWRHLIYTPHFVLHIAMTSKNRWCLW